MATTTVTSEQWEAWRAFYVMRRQLDRALDLQLQRESAISAPEYETLVALSAAPDRRLRAKELAMAMGWEKSRVSHQVTRMEARGLVERAPCETDARSSWIGLTAEGRRTVLGAMRAHTAAISRYFFDVLDDAQTIELTKLSRNVVNAIGCGSDEDV